MQKWAYSRMLKKEREREREREKEGGERNPVYMKEMEEGVYKSLYMISLIPSLSLSFVLSLSVSVSLFLLLSLSLYIYIYMCVCVCVCVCVCGGKVCKWSNKTPVNKLNKFYIFKLSEKFVEKQMLQSLFL